MKFEIGDRVRVIAADHYVRRTGEIGTVVKTEDGSAATYCYWVRFKREVSHNYGIGPLHNWFRKDQLELFFQREDMFDEAE